MDPLALVGSPWTHWGVFVLFYASFDAVALRIAPYNYARNITSMRNFAAISLGVIMKSVTVKKL